MVRRSSIYFIIVMFIGLMCIPLVFIFPEYKDILYFWWVLLLPYLPFKIYFPNSKVTKWGETEIKINSYVDKENKKNIDEK